MRTIRKYERSILKAIGIKDSTPRRISCKEEVEVTCAYCHIITDKRPMYQLLKSFKKNWYGWVCYKCAKAIRKRGCKKFWSNPINRIVTVEKRKETAKNKKIQENIT